jgi:pimeloyl-ACP methyl ester carboxylesterase
MNWTIESEGLDLYCESTGDGEALVLLPGFASGMWSWRWQVPELSKYFRVVTFDPRGVSRSAMTGLQPLSIELIADDVATILDSAGIEEAHVLGLSFGGFVAQEFALKYPARLRKLVLASTSFGGANHVSPSLKVLSAFASIEGLNSPERIRQYLTISFSPDFVASDPDTVEEFCRLREKNIVPEDVYLAQLRSAMAFDAESRLSQIGAETLVVTGDTDTIVPMQNSVNLAAAIADGKLEIIEGGSHMAFVSQADKFNRIVENFLST